MKVYYIDEDGKLTGEGESYTLPEGAIEIAPTTDRDVWDGEKWVTPPEPEPQVPTSITARQARLYLYQNDLLDQVEAMIAGNKAYEIEWEYATTIKRNNPLTQAMIVKLELTEAQADTMFIEASKL
jgi:hypothetical protein